MNHRFFLLLLMLISAFSSVAEAEVYKHIADDGTVFYSDKPLKKGDKAYKSQEVMKFKAPKKENSDSNNAKAPARTPYLGNVSRDASPAVAAKPQAQRYESIAMASPKDDSSIRSNNGSITLSADLKPALQTKFKHRLVFVMDGSKTMPSSGASATFQNVDRGTHQFSAEVQDENGKTLLQSSPISVTVHRFSVHRAK